MREAGRADLADDPRLADNAGRVRHQQEVDDAVAAWTATLDADSVFARLESASVPAGPIYSVREMMDDPHYQARGMFETVQVDGRELKVPAMTPRLTATPGQTDFAGVPLGAHNEEVFGTLLGLGRDELEELAGAGII